MSAPRKRTSEQGVRVILAVILAGFGAVFAAASSARADDYPEHEIHSIVNFQPGSPMDILTRWYGARLSELAGKPVVVENKLGAQGAIATDYVARSKPDGYTIMITPASATLAEVAFIFKRIGFDPVKHFDPVLLIAKSGLVVAVDAKNPVNTIAELTDALRKKPGNGAYGTIANAGVVAAELYKAKTKLLTNRVLYNGIYENLLDLYDGQTDFATLDPAAAFEPLRAGKLKALAVTSAARLGALPNVPTMQESGLANYDLTPWVGLVVPAGTPPPIIDKLAAWHRQISATDDAKKALLAFGMDPLEGDAAAMAALLKRDIARWAGFVKLAKIAPI
jgi:tripartite-type tricarboxylate transporter receptor subunit TctC